MQLAGLTLDEAERRIEDAYEAEYVEPYALLGVVNNRVLVFPGEAGQATVIALKPKHNGHWWLKQEASVRPFETHQTHPAKGDEDLVFLMDLSTVDSLELPAQWCKPTTSSAWSTRDCREALADVAAGPNDRHGQFPVFDVSSVVESRLMELQAD